MGELPATNEVSRSEFRRHYTEFVQPAAPALKSLARGHISAGLLAPPSPSRLEAGPAFSKIAALANKIVNARRLSRNQVISTD